LLTHLEQKININAKNKPILTSSLLNCFIIIFGQKDKDCNLICLMHEKEKNKEIETILLQSETSVGNQMI
jgi:hypothetical protein